MKSTTKCLIISVAGLFYWVIEATVESFVFHNNTFFYQLFTPSLHEIWMRILVWIVLGFAIHSKIVTTEQRKSEEKLRRSEERYRNLIETIPEVIFTISQDGIIKSLNPTFEKITGWPVHEWVNRNFAPLIHPEDLPLAMERMDIALKGKSPLPYELRVRSRNSGYLIGEFNIAPDIDNGVITGISGLARNITDKKKLEEQIYRTQQDWEYTFNSITDMVTVHDNDYNIIQANKAAQKILGIPFLRDTGALHAKCFEFYHGSNHPPQGCPSCNCLQTGKPAMFEIFEPHLNMFIEIRAIPRFDSNNNLIGLIHVVRDITERKNNEAALKKHSDELSALNEASNALMILMDINKIYQEICNIAYTVFDIKMVWLGIVESGNYEVKPVANAGCGSDYLLNIKVRWDDSPEGMGPTGMAIKTMKPYKSNKNDIFFAPWKAEAENAGFISSLAVPLITTGGKCIGSLNFYSDSPDYFSDDRIRLCQIFANQSASAIENVRLIAGLEDKVKERTRELEDAKLLAEAANRAKSDFLANMSHELRTPLNAILGFSEIMKEGLTGPLNQEQQDYINDIFNSGNHLLSLINDILDLAKIEAGKVELNYTEIDLKRLIESCVHLFRERAIKHNIKIEMYIDNNIGIFIADERKLKQIILNILSNAFKFTLDRGSVSIKARKLSGSYLRDQHTDIEKNKDAGYAIEHAKSTSDVEHKTNNAEIKGDYIEISVTDTGIGISEEDQKKLFKPFQQVESTLSKKYPGAGLGLNLCKRLLELHGGNIRVKSEPGKGSIFTFIIPARQYVISKINIE